MIAAWEKIQEAGTDGDVFEEVLDACNSSPQIRIQIFRQEQINEAGLYFTLLLGYLAADSRSVGLRLLVKALDELMLDIGVSAVYKDDDEVDDDDILISEGDSK